MKGVLLLLLALVGTQSCITRQDAINRAMEWVNAHVPYDASSTHNGYVQGCSGLVGYAWQFPKPGGAASSELIPGGYCKQISKNELQMGDIMVCPGTHELLFHSWANSDKSSYWGIELGGPHGAFKHEIAWPYQAGQNPKCYVPCKVVKACSAAPEDILQSE